MRFILYLTILLGVVLSGCNSSSSEPSTDIQTGRFLGMNITGLQYKTPSLSGTIEDGEFEYQVGETVTVSFLGKELAQFTGSTLYDLGEFTTEFPETSEDFYSAFFLAEGYADFIVLANIVQLVAMLDADENPENGFDVSAFESVESLATPIDFTMAPGDFFDQTLVEIANEVQSNRNVVPALSMAYLFDVADIGVPHTVLSTTVYDDAIDGAIDSTTLSSYSAQDFIEYKSTRDGNSILTSDSVYEVDEFSRLISERHYEYDSSGETTFERGITYSYNQLSQVVESYEYYDYNGDGQVDTGGLFSYEYDETGLVTTYSNLNGANFTQRFYVYNSDRTIASYTETRDTDNDDNPEHLLYYSYQYDEGLEIEERIETDYDANETIDQTSIMSTTYENGQKVEYRSRRYDELNELNYEYLEDYSYDENQNLIGYDYTVDFNGDGSGDFLYETEYVINNDGYTESKNTLVYDDGATLSEKKRTVYTDPVEGELGGSTVYSDEDADGTEDSSIRYIYTYTEDGDRESYIRQKDTDNDGVVDEEESYTYTYNEFSNGIRAYLSEHYYLWSL